MELIIRRVVTAPFIHIADLPLLFQQFGNICRCGAFSGAR
jgi:hypothetical protein